MVLPGVASVTVYRLRGDEVSDQWQGKTWDWSSPDRLKINGCQFQPLVGDEFNEGRDAIITRWEWHGPPNADVKGTDRIEFEGIPYDIDGSVESFKALGLDHKHAICRRADG